jgi:hypothetical protein
MDSVTPDTTISTEQETGLDVDECVKTESGWKKCLDRIKPEKNVMDNIALHQNQNQNRLDGIFLHTL